MKIEVTNTKQGKNYLSTTEDTLIRSVQVRKVDGLLVVAVVLNDDKAKFVHAGIDDPHTYADHSLELEFKRGTLHSVVRLTSKSDEEHRLLGGHTVGWTQSDGVYYFIVVLCPACLKEKGTLIAVWQSE